jgi:hypothetical protein
MKEVLPSTAIVLNAFLPEAVASLLASTTSPGDALLVLDACVFDSKAWKCFPLKRLLAVEGVTTFNVAQYASPESAPIPCPQRSAYTFAMREMDILSLKYLHSRHFDKFATFEEFSQAMEEHTADFGCLVADATKREMSHCEPTQFLTVHG